MTEKLPPVHPGEILLEDYLKPLGMSPHQLALMLNVPPNRIYQIANCDRAITPETALRLGRYFGTSAELWLKLQIDYDLGVLRDMKGKDIEREVTPRQAAEAASATA